jgi:intein/homing endonuclease
METNAVNTQLTPEFLESLSKEERTDLLEYLTNYPFIRWMIDPNRPYAKDLERDSDGKIIVNVVKPHILENMNYFRKPALAYKKYGKYTNLRPNGNPNSPYMKWLRKEVLKCWYGCKRPSDGEWITGYHYFYLNYSPIERATTNIKDTNAVNRVVDFPDFYDGDYIFFHYINQARYGGMYNEYKGGNHSALIAARGKGKSFKVASMTTRNFVLGENIDVSEKVKSVIVASNTEYLKKDGTLNKVMAMTDFLALNTQFPSSRLKSSTQEMHWVMGYKDTKNKDVSLGTRNEVIGLSLNNDSDKARGKRSHLMVWEEFGMFPGFIDAWNTSRPNVEEGGYSFGQAIALGTGGTEGSDFSGALEMIYNPLGYNVYGVPNVFDKGTSGGSKSILFIGEYMNRKGCYDKDGNSDIVKAVLEEVKERVFIKYNSTDPATIAQRIAEHPMSIQEAVMRRDGTLFPVADLTDHLNYIESNKIEWNRGHLVGELYQDPNGIVQFRPTDEEPIRDFPLKDNRHKGALEIYELPKEVNGKVPSYRYIGGIDPVDDDHSTTVSLPSIFVLDMFTDRIVAEYTGRPNFADDFYEICRKLALFYNASLNYENDKKGLFTYFSNHHCTYMLCDTPDILRDIELVKSSLYGNKAHSYDQLVYTPKGLQRWEEIKVGDYLFDTQGGVTKVLEIPFDNETEIYKITLQDGRTIEASGNHLWKVIDYNGLEKIKTTSELKSKYLKQKGKYQESLYYIPSNKGIEYEEQEVKIDPYFLGLLLGDGTLGSATRNKISFTSAIQDIKEYSNILNFKYKTFDDRHHSIECSNIKSHLQELDLYDKRSHTKFIPDLYKYNSKKVRLELLKGLMDTDGTCEDNGNSGYTTVSERLAQDVLFLVRSLGINCNLNISSNSYGLVYNIRIYTDTPIFKLSRKYSKQKITKNRAFKTGIRKIEYIGKKRAKCVTVDSQDHCYLIGDFVVTHNSKGTNSGKQVNAYARRLIRDWLLQPIKTKQIVKDENGNEIEKEVTIKNLQRIRGTALLKELITWNPDINADRVSALGMLMILRENNMKYLPGEGQFEGKRPRKNYLGNDPFFSKNYGI